MLRRLGLGVVVTATLFAGAFVSRAEEDAAAERARILADVREVLATSDSFAAAELLQHEGSTKTVVGRYTGAVDDLYWKAKDLPGSLAVGRAAILYCLTRSQETDDAAERRELRVAAQELSFNLASYSWEGWEENGIAIGPAERAAGLDAARLDLRLVREMEYPPTKRANAHWIVGAQLLGAGRHADARAEFEASREMARKAEDATKEWMADGYAGVARALEKPDDKGGRAQVDAAKAELVKIGTDDAKYYATQLDDVLRIFTRE